MVFDEHIFPFVELHPNVGARLRSEILLLPPTLTNPSHDFGDDNSLDHFDNDSLHTNPMSKRAAHEKNPTSNELNLARNGRHFMLPEQFPILAGTGGDPQSDSPAPSTAEPT